ncbi:glycosyltransferase [Aggregatimonas sangjinii]|uniref:Glycosyltransferase n=1 Tax=Aggregatimonas sangjinii TaxID=2583587 RepID=A0A5B7SNH0_9FLAO|nr:glycosyltransferase [Aggregatimonas sangjinii]QCX00067.1 glycosyltransferase [Aggregatimonas sangjinii]
MKKNLLVIGTTWPEPQATAAGGRMERLMAFFTDEGYQITFASTANESSLSMDLQLLGIQKKSIVLNHSSFDDFLSALQPNIVLFDRFPMEEQFGWRVAEFAPGALRILDTEDLHSLRKTRETALKDNITWNRDYWLQADITKREIASIYRCDLSLIISDFEMDLLQNTLCLDDSLLFHLPFMVGPLDDKVVAEWPAFEQRTDFVFIGTGKHAPNKDAVQWLKKEIWPLIREELPTANCSIYGSYLPEAITQLHRPKEGFYIEGEAQNVVALMQSKRINLAPLRFGAGIKGKLMTGMLCGTPSITTLIGVEGMRGNLAWNGRIAATAEEFAAAAVALYGNPNEWEAAQNNGKILINTLFDAQALKRKLALKLEKLVVDIPAHRRQNFIGGLLQHQTMSSTMYMSKWITEKNRK